MSDLAILGVAYAEVQAGMWIARCPRRDCWNAVALILGDPVMVCHGDRHACGAESPIVWPRDPEAIAALLRMRPAPLTQNWLPHETLQDLLTENAEHGCLPPEWLALEQRTLILHEVEGMAMAGLLADSLPPPAQRLMLTGVAS